MDWQLDENEYAYRTLQSNSNFVSFTPFKHTRTMQTLIKSDVQFLIRRLPRKLATLMTSEAWYNKIFVGGGFIRCVITGEPINDVDIFVRDKKDAAIIAAHLSNNPSDIHTTENAITVRGPIPMQVITRWVFQEAADVAESFDFTICCAVISFNGNWKGYCDENFYPDLAAKRLVYRVPMRNEDAGGSMLRVLKYYQRGYRIPLNCLAAVIARLLKGIDKGKLTGAGVDLQDEGEIARIITGLLFEVDPNTVMHDAYLPSTDTLIELDELAAQVPTGANLLPATEYRNVRLPYESAPEELLNFQSPLTIYGRNLHEILFKNLSMAPDREAARKHLAKALNHFDAHTFADLHPNDYSDFKNYYNKLKVKS